MHFMVFTERFDAKVMCRFLERLIGHFDRKAQLVVDGHSVHRSRKVRDWLADHSDRIELHFLPPYLPELNPDELVNADLKRSLPTHSRARDQTQLAAETRRFFHRRQRQPHTIRGYFGGTPRPLHPRIEPFEFRVNARSRSICTSTFITVGNRTRRSLRRTGTTTEIYCARQPMNISVLRVPVSVPVS